MELDFEAMIKSFGHLEKGSWIRKISHAKTQRIRGINSLRLCVRIGGSRGRS